MEKIYGMKKYCLALCIMVLGLCVVSSVAQAEKLTSSTSLTVVNVTEIVRGDPDISVYSGAWPNSPDDNPLVMSADEPYETHLKNVTFTSHSMGWETVPGNTPYTPFYNTVNSMVCAVWSTDGGKTFTSQSWDYLATNTHGKGLHNGMPNCWMGTVIHTLCDRKADECNGRYRTNLRFAIYPSPDSSCWGTAAMQ